MNSITCLTRETLGIANYQTCGGGGGFDQNKTIRIQELFFTYKIMKIYIKEMIKYCRQAQEKKIA